MPTYRLTVEYDGTDFCGWQRQRTGRTVQEVLARALRTLLPEADLWPVGASRTDAGVHARGQVVSVETSRHLPPLGLMRGTNSLLPPDVAVVDAALAPDGFHARFDARGKTYRYRILNRRVPSALEARYSWHIRHPLDLARMEAAALPLLGEHDFSAFRAADCGAASPFRRLDSIRFFREPGREEVVVVEVTGNAFLKHMVRNLVGVLVEVGRNHRDAEDVGRILESRDRTRAGVTAPACGLFLWEVRYGDAASPTRLSPPHAGRPPGPSGAG